MSALARKIVLVGIICLVMMGIFARILWVNAHAPRLPTETYRVGEWVELSGSYAATNEECTEGYKLRVTGACIMTPREYIDAYHEGGSGDAGQSVEGKYLDITPEAMDVPSLVVVNLEMVNGDNENGFLLASAWRAVSLGHRELALSVDLDSWSLAEGALDGTASFALRKDSQYLTHVPFCDQEDPSYLESYGEMRRPMAESGDYELILTNLPVRKVIQFAVDRA